jgi:hypothetical protein
MMRGAFAWMVGVLVGVMAGAVFVMMFAVGVMMPAVFVMMIVVGMTVLAVRVMMIVVGVMMFAVGVIGGFRRPVAFRDYEMAALQRRANHIVKGAADIAQPQPCGQDAHFRFAARQCGRGGDEHVTADAVLRFDQ